MKKPCNKVGYIRTSKDEQHPENQRRKLIEAGVVEDCIFEDKGISGTVEPHKRPRFQKMMAYIKDHPGEVKYLYVYEISRLGRNTLETLNVIDEIERGQGVMVMSLSPNETFTQSEDKACRTLLLMLMSWVANRERDNLVERTKAGIQRARDEGKELGRPRKKIDWHEVQRMREEENVSWEMIAKRLNISTMTLHRRKRKMGWE
jgi:DNA invertase Pin-like site-specific DNA recombinase